MSEDLNIRVVQEEDNEVVQVFWYSGFMELVWDLTSTLSPIYIGKNAYSFPRPVVAATAAAGGVYAVASDNPVAGVAMIIGGMTFMSFFHIRTLIAIDGICRKDIFSGDMTDIRSTWIVDKKSVFYVAEMGPGRVVGSVAVKCGGVKDYSKKEGEELSEPDSCSIWKLSTDSNVRRGGVAKRLMQQAEIWAREEAGAVRMRLVTGSIKAKGFYKRMGYQVYDGSALGARISYWEKLFE